MAVRVMPRTLFTRYVSARHRVTHATRVTRRVHTPVPLFFFPLYVSVASAKLYAAIECHGCTQHGKQISHRSKAVLRETWHSFVLISRFRFCFYFFRQLQWPGHKEVTNKKLKVAIYRNIRRIKWELKWSRAFTACLTYNDMFYCALASSSTFRFLLHYICFKFTLD